MTFYLMCFEISDRTQMHLYLFFRDIWFKYFKIISDKFTLDIFSFLWKILFEDRSPFSWTTDTPVVDLLLCLPWVSKPRWIPLFVYFVTFVKRIPQIRLWFDLLTASMAVELFHLHTCVQALVRLQSRIKHDAPPTTFDKTEALPIQLRRLGYWIYFLFVTASELGAKFRPALFEVYCRTQIKLFWTQEKVSQGQTNEFFLPCV